MPRGTVNREFFADKIFYHINFRVFLFLSLCPLNEMSLLDLFVEKIILSI